ncbi:MAG TPA: GNAT family N-acetyltransferase [Conexibacter sp.]|jgi:CelD/BcsL family acetyltransferase involved in cellulose biosynthesis|nr:GNAT family N-acetyltransferase [Conexibacter sp.]
MLEAELVTEIERLAALEAEWDALAVADALPQMSPAWVLAWWRHVAPAGAVPRSVAVRDDGVLVGLAPYYVVPGGGGRVDYRLPGIEITARLAPLAVRDREWEVAEAIGRALAGASPRPDALLFEGIAVDGQWQTALRERWPGPLRPPLWRTHVDGSPFVSLREQSFEAWMAAKSSNFRQQMRRLRRRFAQAGGVSRLATRATLADDAAAFVRLHASRWDGRGHSNLVDLGERFAATIVDAGERLLDDERLALRVLELDGEPICAQLFIEAGGTVLFVNGGWDERHAALKPSLLCLLDAVEDAFAQGRGRLDLGVGEQSYKRRFADGDAPLEWALLLAPTGRLALSAARSSRAVARAQVRALALRGLSEERVAQLRRLTGGRRGIDP